MANCVASSQFSLLWSGYRKNICDGLAALQQNGEFVDMTLAADGHHVKVHQLIIALASPYIKELISTAQCPHPVIFLNKVSYKTLCAILEYIYTGEVAVFMDDLKVFLEACKELHIKGLEDMKVHDTIVNSQLKQEDNVYYNTQSNEDVYFEIAEPEPVHPEDLRKVDTTRIKILSTNLEEPLNDSHADDDMSEAPFNRDIDINESINSGNNQDIKSSMQYTVSNRGSLQMILNRYVYYLKHTNRNNTQQWRCVDYLNNTKCPALVFTRNDTVIQRISAHVHPFHDKRILTKVRNGAVFTAIKEAEENGKRKKNQDVGSD